ncbi:GNAT family N-acetyltransferase [Vibrio sp. SCSIO 43136]|uniref:GNAT family N-acetyltransferase n=1 Tax=Vibrio sp. SCSIO 43136 TaxID=2819101 RepID=UPI002075DD1D|nr:GNAT family N-acetyltransferase [Vibrio sp. SCSIO 43136]USD66962.1 GNAT family N-acetyltransferase [Vibrio sp. SCSIO 43136]
MVELLPYEPQWRDQVLALSVNDDQVEFTVANMKDAIDLAEAFERLVLVIENHNVVGFFKLDMTYSERYDFCPNTAIGLRSMLIDSAHQGRSLGSMALKQLAEYVSMRWLTVEYVYLTVNCRNKGAYKSYLKSGFMDTDTLYHGGPVGPQHVMRLAIT